MKLQAALILVGVLLAGCAGKPAPETFANRQPQSAEYEKAKAIQEHIERFWLKPPGVNTIGLYSVMRVRTDDVGNVLSADIVKTSGKPGYDASIMRAIRKASPLPLPVDNRKKFLLIELHFEGV
jgi:TonB family protein